MNTSIFPQIAEALRAVAALLDEAAEGAARAAAAQPELPVAKDDGIDYGKLPAEQMPFLSAKPAPQGCAPEGIAPPADQVPAPGAASTDVSTADESAAVAPQDEAPQPEPEPEPEAETAAPAPIQPSYDDAKAAVINLGKTLGREAITELLAGFNAKRLPEVPQDQLAYVIAAANKRLEQHFFEENEQALAEDLGEAGW